MSSAFISILIFFIAISFGKAQESARLHNPALTSDEISEYQKLFEDKTEIEESICDLVAQAREDDSNGKKYEALKKIQLALLLEKHNPNPGPSSFDLNHYAGDIATTFNLRYALEFYKKATNIISKGTAIAAGGKFTLYTNKAGIHVKLHELDSALYWYRKAIEEAQYDTQVGQASSINNLGVFYHRTHKTDSARVYFEKALIRLGDKENSIPLYCAIKDNLAQLDLLEHKIEPAIATFIYNDSVYYARGVPNKYVVNKVRLLQTMHSASISGVRDQIPQLEKYIKEHALHIPSEEVLAFYRFANNFFLDQEDKQNHRRYYSEYLHLIDSLDRRTEELMHFLTQSLLAVQENSFQSEITAHQLTLDKKQLELKSARALIIISILAAMFVITALILFIRKRKLQHEAEKKLADSELRNKEMKARLMEQELELKKRDLTEIVLHNTHVYDSNQKMIDRLHDIAVRNSTVEEKIRPLLFELQSQNQISERSIGLQTNIESVNAEFFEKLKLKFPQLTKAEAELCGYIRINLSSKDISILKNVEASSIKKSKTRLRKKLELGPEEDLYYYIRGI